MPSPWNTFTVSAPCSEGGARKAPLAIQAKSSFRESWGTSLQVLALRVHIHPKTMRGVSMRPQWLDMSGHVPYLHFVQSRACVLWNSHYACLWPFWATQKIYNFQIMVLCVCRAYAPDVGQAWHHCIGNAQVKPLAGARHATVHTLTCEQQGQPADCRDRTQKHVSIFKCWQPVYSFKLACFYEIVTEFI